MSGHLSLLGAVRTIVRADSDAARQTLFARVASTRPAVRAVLRLHELLAPTPLAAWLVSLYGLASYVRVSLDGNPSPYVVGIAGHENAQRQVTRILSWLGHERCAWLRKGRPNVTAPWHLVVARRQVTRSVRIVRRVGRRHGFLVSCRTASALAWYARALRVLTDHTPGAVLVSSNANPEEAGTLAAAKRLGVPQVYVSHAYPTPFSPPLDFTLSILEGEAAAEAYRHKGPVRGEILLAGVEGESARLDASRIDRPTPTIGVFPPKAFSWDTLAAIIDDCRSHHHAARILIRWHPSMLESPRLPQVLQSLDRVVETDRGASLSSVASQCDWVVAGENSNVHLPVLKLGVPTVSVKGLGLYADDRSDLYGFVAHHVVLPPVASLRDLNSAVVHAFFSGGWAERFARYDASYLSDQRDTGEAIRRAVATVVAQASERRRPS